MRATWLVVWALSAWLVGATALARVERFAVVVGNNRGFASDVALRYAEADARKVAEVLRELGPIEPANMVVLTGSDAETTRRTLITVNDRIRAAVSQPDTSVVLFVYYSGHADENALHLGETRLETTELAELVRGSAASFRLLVVDACRSGKLTRPKGGKLRPPFALRDEAQLPSEGLAFLTASTADEDAQESDELKGSFFTHALVSGLLGAADQDGDGAVVLDEAYRYAYDATLRSTSRS
ncbi:MAG TPA: caspase family protein, partial [Polyangiales bacterium]